MLALEDDEPQVVQASLAAISDKGDPSVVQELQRVLGDNDDPRLQQQLGETIEHLHSQPRLDPELSDITEYARVTAAHAPREAPTGPHERLEQGSAAQ
jgi:HEAT repeat protein